MPNESSKGLLIAILVISGANLLVAAVQTGILLRPSGQRTSAVATTALPSKYTDAVLAQIAASVTGPYNRGDTEALYNALDEFAKGQVTRSRFEEQMAKLKQLVGNVGSASYNGFQQLPTDGGVQAYKLTYTVTLSGGQMPSGIMYITVLDHPSKPGIVGFFINGLSQ